MKKYSLMTLTVALLAVSAIDTTRAVMSPNNKQKALERVRYLEFAGQQQDWPLCQKPMVEIQNTKYGTPIYYDLPNKPYEVLGSLQASDGNVIKHAVEAAQAIGADAILVVEDKAFSDAGIKLHPQVSARGSSTGKLKMLEGILIRWKRKATVPTPAPPPDAVH